MDPHYIRLHLYEKCTKMYSLFVCAAIKKSQCGFKAFHYPILLIPLGNLTFICFHSKKKKVVFLKFNAKRGQFSFATLNFSKWGGQLPPAPSHMM